MGKTRSSFVWTRSTFVQFQVFWRDRSYLSFIKQVIFTIIDIMSWSRFIAFFLKVFKSLVELDDCKSLTFNNTQKICFWLFLSTMFCLFFSVTSSDFLHGLARFRFFFKFSHRWRHYQYLQNFLLFFLRRIKIIFFSYFSNVIKDYKINLDTASWRNFCLQIS